MDRLTWHRLEAIGAGALERPGDARANYIEAMCAGDGALIREVRALLEQIDADPEFLETPALGPRATERDSSWLPEDVTHATTIGPYPEPMLAPCGSRM